MVNLLRFKHLLLTAALLLGSVSSFAYDFEVDGIYYNKLSENTVEVTSFDELPDMSGILYDYSQFWGEGSYHGSINIPAEINANGEKYDVIAIGYGAFGNSSGLVVQYSVKKS